MTKLFIYILISGIIAVTSFSCAGYQVSYGVGYGVHSGPYGYGGYPNIRVGVYGGGFPRYGY